MKGLAVNESTSNHLAFHESRKKFPPTFQISKGGVFISMRVLVLYTKLMINPRTMDFQTRVSSVSHQCRPRSWHSLGSCLQSFLRSHNHERSKIRIIEKIMLLTTRVVSLRHILRSDRIVPGLSGDCLESLESILAPLTDNRHLPEQYSSQLQTK